LHGSMTSRVPVQIRRFCMGESASGTLSLCRECLGLEESGRLIPCLPFMLYLWLCLTRPTSMLSAKNLTRYSQAFEVHLYLHLRNGCSSLTTYQALSLVLTLADYKAALLSILTTTTLYTTSWRVLTSRNAVERLLRPRQQAKSQSLVFLASPEVRNYVGQPCKYLQSPVTFESS